LLLNRPYGNASILVLPRCGLSDPTDWDDLVCFVEERVPDHPRDPAPRSLRVISTSGE